MSPIKKGTKLTNKPKNTMLRVRLDDDTVNKLDFITYNKKISKSEAVRIGINEQYKKLKNEK